MRQRSRTSAKSKQRSRKKPRVSIPALRKKFSREEQEAWGLALSREAKAIIRAKLSGASRTDEPSNPPYRIPALRLNEILDRTLTGIAQLKKHGATKEQLKRVRAALDATGKKPGPKTDPEANQRMVEILRGLCSGKQLKQAAEYADKAASASAQLGRFCVDFYELASMFEEAAADIWNDQYVTKVFRERYGFNLPADLLAAKEAYKRGCAYYQRPRRDRSSRRKQLPPPSHSPQVN